MFGCRIRDMAATALTNWVSSAGEVKDMTFTATSVPCQLPVAGHRRL